MRWARRGPTWNATRGRKLTVIAWLWARTVKSPNPAFADVEVPLVSTFMLSTKKGKEAYVEPVIEDRGYRFTVKVGAPPDAATAKAGTKLSRGANFRCLMSGAVVNDPYIKSESMAGRMGARFDGHRGRGKAWAGFILRRRRNMKRSRARQSRSGHRINR